VLVAGTTAALVTAPPDVGSPMALAGIATPAKSAQAAGACAATMGTVQAINISAAKPRPDKRAALIPCSLSISSPWLQIEARAQVARRIGGNGGRPVTSGPRRLQSRCLTSAIRHSI
jgi:hypothetical protein